MRSRRNYLTEELEPRRLLAAPPLPVIPAGTFNIASYGATPNDSTDDTTAIQNAINACRNAGGGTVVIPSGTFLSGPLTLYSFMNLNLPNVDSKLMALPYGQYPGSGTTSVSRWLNWTNTTQIEVSGLGTFDGQGGVTNAQGQSWWSAYTADNTIGRPRMFQINNSSYVYIHGVTVRMSPQFHIAFGGDNAYITIDGITVFSPGTGAPNTDGIDPTGQHILIQNCNVSVGDDNVVPKPGGTFCSDITIQHCTFGTGHGVSVGGQTNMGLDGMIVDDCTFNGTDNGIRLKADRTEGGLVKNITYSNITMTNVRYPILFYSYYDTGLPTSAAADTTTTPSATEPYWQDITITNFTSTSTTSGYYAGVIWGLPEAPIKNVTMNNVHLTANRGFEINHARNIVFDSNSGITVSGGGGRLISTTSVATPYDATIVKSGWSDVDIGAPTPLSSSVFDPNTGNWNLVAGGADIGGTSDQFNFASTEFTGDLEVSARLTSVSNTHANAKAGVMVRDGTAANARFAAVVVQPNRQVVFVYRSSGGGSAVSVGPVGDTTNAKYVKLRRVGTAFTPYYSTDGINWTSISSAVTVAMPTSAKVGIGVSGHNTASACTGVFTGVNVTPYTNNNGPSVTAKSYLLTALNKLSFSFSANVSASLSTANLTVVTVPNNTPVSVFSVSYDSATNTATFTLTPALASGNYSATLSGGMTIDASGNPLAGGDSVLPFFVLPGDGNRDGIVNALDFNALASNYGSTSATLAMGDFSFDGKVNSTDFSVVAVRFNTKLTIAAAPEPSPPEPSMSVSAVPMTFAAASKSTLFATESIESASVNLADDLLDPLALAGNAL